MDCHDWVMGVLADISEYAGMNNMPKLQGMAEDARAVAQVEIYEEKSDHYKDLMKMVLAVPPQSTKL